MVRSMTCRRQLELDKQRRTIEAKETEIANHLREFAVYRDLKVRTA